jgi:cell wall-associated NlpC family hydrolase
MSTSKPMDPRRHPWRDDLAAEHLRGRVTATRFTAGEPAIVQRAVAAVRKRPDPEAGFETELVFGEPVTVYERAGAWAWVQADLDGYVGYMIADALAPPLAAPATHVVRALATFLYPRPDIKTPPVVDLSIGSRVSVVETTERFVQLATGGFAVAHHLAPLSHFARDYVTVAERFVGTPYLWGGRSRHGVDCSGLIQIAMQAAGLECPRDSDMQAAEIGAAVAVPDVLARADAEGALVEDMRRGDLLCWPGHVAVALDADMIVHANGHHMSTVIEPAIDAAVRIKKATGHGVTALRRPAALGRAAA